MMKANSPIGLYVHIPFCLRKCNYCDFCSFADLTHAEKNAYINALCREIKSYKRENKISLDSIFFGGGTPSLLSREEFKIIYDAISESFDISLDTEFTLEVNPRTLSWDNLLGYISCGVNRISIGVQTIHENEYKILGRINSLNDFINTYNLVRKSGIQNISVDLMYGIPEQTKDSLNATLDKIISLKPAHISAYSLILEEGTRLFEMKDKLLFPDEDADSDMYELILDKLSKAGYHHYEISNYALPGYESKHNLKYWHCNEYIGVGISAYSYFGNRRFGNTNNFTEYLIQNPTKYSYDEIIDDESLAYEYVMLSLRLSSGFSLDEYKERFGRDFVVGREDIINKFILSGHMKISDNRIFLTEKGLYISNAILTELI